MTSRTIAVISGSAAVAFAMYWLLRSAVSAKPLPLAKRLLRLFSQPPKGLPPPQRGKSASIMRVIAAANLSWSWQTFCLFSVVAAVGTGAGIGQLLHNPFAGVMGLALGAYVPYEVASFRASQRRKQIGAAMPLALATLTNLYLASGNFYHALQRSIALQREPLRSEFYRVVAAYDANTPLEVALADAIARVDNRDFTSYVAIFLACRGSGANPAPAMRSVLSMIQDRQTIQSELQAETAAPKLAVYALIAMVGYYAMRLFSDPWAHYLYTQTLAGRALIAGAILVGLLTLAMTNWIARV